MSALSSREWATVFWLVLLVGFCLTRPSLRRSFAGVLRAALAPKLIVIFVVVAAWLAVLVAAGNSVGLWNDGLWKDTVVWYVVSGLALGSAALKASKEANFFKQELKRLVGLTVLLQFVLNLYTFNFFIEVPLQAFLALLIATSTYAAHQEQYAPARKLIDGLLTVIGFGLLAATVAGIVDSWRTIDAEQKILELAFSVWVPALMLPLTYVVALVMVYEQCFLRVRFRAKQDLSLGVKAAVVWATKMRLEKAKALSQSPARLHALGEASTGRQARAALEEA